MQLDTSAADDAAAKQGIDVGKHISGYHLVGLLAKSQALIADGVHSLSDLLGNFIVFLSSHFGKKRSAEPQNR